MDDLRVAHAVRKLCPTLELSESVAIEAGKLVKSNLREIIKTARVFARQSKRISLSLEDINLALGLHGFEVLLLFSNSQSLCSADLRISEVPGSEAHSSGGERSVLCTRC